MFYKRSHYQCWLNILTREYSIVYIFFLRNNLLKKLFIINSFPKKQGKEVYVPIKVQKNLHAEMDLKVLVGNSPASAQYFVFELTVNLPKFSSLMVNLFFFWLIKNIK